MKVVKFRRGQIWWYRPGGDYNGATYTQGKSRPIIIVSNDLANKYSSNLLAIPCTSQDKKCMPTHVKFEIDGLNTTSLAENLMSVNINKIGDYIGTVDEELLQKIENTILIALGMKALIKIERDLEVEDDLFSLQDSNATEHLEEDSENISEVSNPKIIQVDLSVEPKRQGRNPKYTDDEMIRFINDYENHDAEYMFKKYNIKDKHALHQKVYLFRKKLKNVV